MPTVVENGIVAADIDSVWAVVGRFDGLAEWVPAIRSCVLRAGSSACEVGSVRELVMRDGGRLVERQTARSPGEHSYSYAVIETALPVRDYHSTLRLTVADDGRTLLEWTGGFEAAPENVDAISHLTRSVYQLGIRTLQKRFTATG